MKVTIVDHQHIFREGLQGLIEAENDLEIVASYKKASDLSEKEIEETNLFLIDIEVIIEERSFINRYILKKRSNKKLIALSSDTGKQDVKKAVLLGCHGFLLKEMSYPKFIHAVRMIAHQGSFIHPQALYHIIKDYRLLAKGQHEVMDPISNDTQQEQVCTTREHEILQLLVNGNDNSSIAEKLAISEKTVKNHLTNIFRKLNVKDRTQAAVLAIRNDWVQF